jgi:thiol-disulfide isomerase/thioredoxin
MATKKSKKESTLYYFHSVGCAFCKRIDPIIDELNNEGKNILKLDLSDKDNEGLKKEISEKYKIDCGTPLLVDAKTGNHICGFRGEDIIKKWADGEKIPEIPKPKSPPPTLPKDLDDDKQVKIWEKEYSKWVKENKHLPNIMSSEAILEKLRDIEKQKQIQKNSVEGRLETIEMNLQKLMNHLGVK